MKQRICKYCGKDLTGTKYISICGKKRCRDKQVKDNRARARAYNRRVQADEKAALLARSPRSCDHCGRSRVPRLVES